MAFPIKEFYECKDELIKDLIKACRELKKRHHLWHSKCLYRNIETEIKNEHWSFTIYINYDNSVSTIISVDVKGDCTNYGKTCWKDPYTSKRWDSSLREFLKREILKDEGEVNG